MKHIFPEPSYVPLLLVIEFLGYETQTLINSTLESDIEINEKKILLVITRAIWDQNTEHSIKHCLGELVNQSCDMEVTG